MKELKITERTIDSESVFKTDNPRLVKIYPPLSKK
jgi:hypothetical protein